jgi:uncharacterized membrane protein YccF (DUF307 family)
MSAISLLLNLLWIVFGGLNAALAQGKPTIVIAMTTAAIICRDKLIRSPSL